MDGFRNILLIHDDEAGFESALARAVSLAKSNGATLTIAEVIPGPAGGPLARLNPFASAAPTLDESGYRDRLDGILAEARRRNVDVRPAILRGAPDVEIVRTVLRQGHDLVITAEESRSTLEGVLFGKPSSRIMRACPCPVWVVKPEAETRCRRIVAAIEAGGADGAPEDIDQAVLSLAGTLARAEGCKLDIVHAWDFKGRDLETSRSELTPSMWRALYRRNRLAHAKTLRGVLSRFDLDGIDHEVHMPKGDPYRVLLGFSWKDDVDLIVAGTVSRTGLDRFIYSNLVERILPLADCAVLAVKSAAFVPSIEKAASHRPTRPVAVGQRMGMTSGTFSERIR
ncbi:MAG: universal stress protein [Rhodospirillales bacterium]|nr:universal stress protein [Rhodospirillales bacterium]